MNNFTCSTSALVFDSSISVIETSSGSNSTSLNTFKQDNPKLVKALASLATAAFLTSASASVFSAYNPDIHGTTNLAFEIPTSYKTIYGDDLQWLTLDSREFLIRNFGSNLESLKTFANLIYTTLGPAKLSSQIYDDTDEGWSRVVVNIDLNVLDDVEKQISLENVLFAEIWKFSSLKELTSKIIINIV